MITNKEWQAVELSATKKDFYQIWNELLDTASKISERWSPESTNESDPGIVLLKVLTAVADKLNYNIDKNTLEAFLPSATQQESMRKICSMMGYNVKYYTSATTNVTITYTPPTLDNYDTETINNKIFTLPIFTNIKNTDDDVNYITIEPVQFSGDWSARQQTVSCIEGELVECESDLDNLISLNLLDDNNRYYLPETQIAENGIFIYNSTNNQLSERWTKVDNLNTQSLNSTIYQFGFDSVEMKPYVQFPEDISSLIGDGLYIYFVRTNGLSGNVKANTLTKLEKPSTWNDEEDSVLKEIFSQDLEDIFTITNNNASTNGANIETINDAYKNYKKIIGTFDTLVTCRDYMNKIYTLLDDDDTTSLVSNVIVSDIRDDINNSIQICSFNEYGICYSTESINSDNLNNFDLVIYPFKTIYDSTNKSEYINSFKYTTENLNDIEEGISKNKTLAHNLKSPKATDIVCIKNYLKIDAKISTVSKLTFNERQTLLNNVYKAIYSNFNNRETEFGEQISYNVLFDVIKNADSRIKNLNLNEAGLYTTIMRADNTETAVYSVLNGTTDDYNKLALRNVLAGRISLFDYDTTFTTKYDEQSNDSTPLKVFPESLTKPSSDSEAIWHITSLKSNFTAPECPITLTDNEVIQFRRPTLKTINTYSSYVNYKLNLTDTGADIPAEFMSLGNFMLETDSEKQSYWDKLYNELTEGSVSPLLVKIQGSSAQEAALQAKGYEWTTIEGNGSYYLPLSKNTFGYWINFLTRQNIAITNGSSSDIGIYGREATSDNAGKLVDSSHYKYSKKSGISIGEADLLTDAFFPINLGKYKSGIIYNGTTYELKSGEYLLLNYTTSDSSDSTVSVTKNIFYGSGTIICPNFDLYSNPNDSVSKTVAAGEKWTDINNKTVSYSSETKMYSLGASNQIEVKEVAKIILDGKVSNNVYQPVFLYWILDENTELEKKQTSTSGYISLFTGNELTYTLKSGEYLYFTNYNKTSLAYYGAGSVITRTSTSVNITKPVDDNRTIDNSNNTNLVKSINWQRYNFNSRNYVGVIEYTLISLTADDILHTINFENTDDKIVSNTWTKCLGATYTLNGNVNYLPKLDLTNYYWEVSSHLDLNVSSSYAQTLTTNDSIQLCGYAWNPNKATIDSSKTHFTYTYTYNGTNYTTSYYVGEDLSVDNAVIVDYNNTDIIEISSPITDCSFKANATYAGSAETTQVKVYEHGSDGEISATPNTFKLKQFALTTLQIKSTSNTDISLDLNLNNFGDYWTTINFENWKLNNTELDYLDLSVNIPEGTHGLIMLYVTNIDNVKPYLTTTDVLTKVNDSSWVAQDGKYYLDAGITVINVKKTSTITLHRPVNTDGTLFNGGTVIIGDLTLVNLEDNFDYPRVNPYLGIELSEAQKKLADKPTLQYLIEKYPEIFDKASQFYWNCPIDTELQLNINTVADETLRSSNSWYDANNVNNKFVISEIDANYLTTGIQIENSSKK